MAAAGVIGTGTHNTGIKHGILPTQVRKQWVHGHRQHLEGFGEMSRHLVWCAQPGGEGEEHCKQDGSVLQGWGCWGHPQVHQAQWDLLICSQNVTQLGTPLSLCFMVLWSDEQALC